MLVQKENFWDYLDLAQIMVFYWKSKACMWTSYNEIYKFIYLNGRKGMLLVYTNASFSA